MNKRNLNENETEKGQKPNEEKGGYSHITLYRVRRRVGSDRILLLRGWLPGRGGGGILFLFCVTGMGDKETFISQDFIKAGNMRYRGFKTSELIIGS